MTKNKINKLGFDDAVKEMEEEGYSITSYDSLKDFAIDKINDDNLFVAIHILKAINEEQSDYYCYDYSMGALETPRALSTIDDLIDIL
ncbi:MAG TPA: hypothetical protein DDW20_01415 [Firmicutes bacterium]|nr:hypothetical protein [Bacillota bacterium]